jgi:glucoamylase
LDEALFDLKIKEIINPDYRIGSPAAGMLFIYPSWYLKLVSECSPRTIDGPPLRALVLIKYAEWLLQPEQKNGTWVADNLWPAINLDLQWIATHWNQSSYVQNCVQLTSRL